VRAKAAIFLAGLAGLSWALCANSASFAQTVPSTIHAAVAQTDATSGHAKTTSGQSDATSSHAKAAATPVHAKAAPGHRAETSSGHAEAAAARHRTEAAPVPADAAPAHAEVASATPASALGHAVVEPGSFSDSENELAVEVGKTVLVDTAKPIARVAVGLGDVAMVSAVNPNELMVNGKKAGQTSLIIWDATGGRQFFNIAVHADMSDTTNGLEAVRHELSLELPQEPVDVSMANGTLFLRGTVKDLTSSARAVKIAETFGKVVNLLDVDVPKSPSQILLKVRFASVDRSLEKQLGINIFSTGLGNVLAGTSTGQFSPPSVSGGGVGGTTTGGTATVSNELNVFAFLPGHDIGATLQALESKSVVEVLAEPNVMAANGKQASFLAGGEFPYPIVQGSSTGGATVTIMFKEYGIRLNFIPTITPQGTIRLQVAPEVSALDYTNEVTVSGFEVPGITTRKVNTEVELRDGQSFMISGLLDNTENETFEKIPFIGDVPILGKLFQSMVRTKNNTELIVIVTPEIVSPMPAGVPTPELNYPTPFMPTNSNIPMHTPDAKTPDNTLAPPQPAIPVETLTDSMKPEKQLQTGGSYGGSSSGASSGGGGSQ
jgi:pilus assembly protein CpaC